MLNKYIKILLLFVFALTALPRFSHARVNHFNEERIYARAEIAKIEKKPFSAGFIETSIYFNILDGKYSGQVKRAVFRGEDDLPRGMSYREGDIIFIGITETGLPDDPLSISFYDYDNTSSIIILAVILIAVIVVIGKLKGLLSLLALIITVLLLFFVFIPLTLEGYPPLPIAIFIAVISIMITLPIIAGLRLKTLAAIIGASTGIIISSLLAVFFGWLMHLSGIVTNDMLTVFYAADIEIDLQSIVLSGMIIAALGAIMDVCISVSSSTSEIFNANPDIASKDAFKSVMNIGTDILGSMVNTLVLAYAGSSLSLILFIALRLDPGMPFWMIFNYNPVLSELVKSAVGSIGMFLCVPITALISVRLFVWRNSGQQ